jgi:heme-degrading protein
MESVERLADYPLFLEGGGQLIRDKSGEVIGSVGVTGDANELDDICAVAGIHAAGLCADSDFFDDPAMMRALSIHKSAPLADPRPKPLKQREPARKRASRNGLGRRQNAQTAKSGP